MTKAALLSEIMQLSPEERLELVEEVLESLPAEPTDFSLTDEQIAELEARFAEHQRDPSSAIPAEEVIAALRSRFR
jgi:putative addiction module component (TIGR02574 family)